MNYRRNIVGNEEYKILINGIDEEINHYDDLIIKLRQRQNELFDIMENIGEEIEDLEKEYDSLQNELIDNIIVAQRKKDILKVLIPGLTVSSTMIGTPLLANFPELATSLLTCLGIANGLGTLFISVEKHIDPFHRTKIEMKTEEKAMEKGENAKLNEKMEQYQIEITRRENEYNRNDVECNNIRHEIYYNQEEKDNCEKKLKTIMSLAKNYDSINELQKMIGISMYENSQREKQTVKVLKRTIN